MAKWAAMSIDPARFVTLGQSGLRVAPIAVGTWAWGERRYWDYEGDFGPNDVADAFTTSVDAGLTLFDTAEVYGDGASEKILGWLVRKSGARVAVATKFGLLPGRKGAADLSRAVDASLRRLGLPRVDLYQIHWCDTSMATVESLMHALADAVASGKVGAVGVSNFSASETKAAHATLASRGVPLASNQVHYSLLHRAPEVDGVLDTCRELGVTLLAYSPLEQGLLTGKYTAEHLPSGPRAGHPEFAPESVALAQPVVALLREIGRARGDRRPEEAAIAWLRAKGGVLPIAGAKTGAQAAANARALDLELDAGEVEALDRAAAAFRRA